MSSLVTVKEFAVWAQEAIEDDDPFTLAVLEAASLLVREEAEQPDWYAETAPERAKLITTMVALRTWNNPPTGVTSSTIGPISERIVETLAMGMELTPAERERLTKLAPTKGPDSGLGGLWVMPLVGDSEPVERDIVLTDSYGTGVAYGHWLDRGAFGIRR